MAAHVAEAAPDKPIELWWQDEMWLGQKNGLVRQWARTGSLLRQPKDQRYQSAYLFGDVCPARGTGAAVVMPEADAEAMQVHLDEISRAVNAGRHAVLLLDRAGWHTAGAPGIVKAIDTCLPRSERQRCLAHRMRNLAAKVPEDIWPGFKARVATAYQAPSRAIARELAQGVAADFAAGLPSAVACAPDDFEACIAHLRMPVTHRRAIRTTNLLERLFVEERRRFKIIANAFGERPVLKLMFGAMIRAAERWNAIRISDFERRQMEALRAELDHEYEARNGLKTKPAADARPTNLSSNSRI